LDGAKMSAALEILPYDRNWPKAFRTERDRIASVLGPRTLAFRDYLREHNAAAREYEALKQSLAPRYSAADFSARQAYADSKAEFITRVTDQAIAQGYPRAFEARRLASHLKCNTR
jgi:GrpB-like predicted nucleotidyltransferase (UPF0157 family)